MTNARLRPLARRASSQRASSVLVMARPIASSATTKSLGSMKASMRRPPPRTAPAGSAPLHAVRTMASLPAALDQAASNRLDMAIGSASRDDHRVGHVRQLAYVENLDIDGLHVLQDGDGDVGQGARCLPGLLGSGGGPGPG